MTYKEFQFLILLWKMGVVDTFNVLKICSNCGSQYLGIVLSSAAGNFSDIGPQVLLEPVFGLGTGIQYVAAAATIAEKRQIIATLAAFLATSAAAVTTDPTTNAALGGAVASKIAYMRAILTRGGGSYNITKAIKSISLSLLEEFAIIVDSTKTPVLDIHPYRKEFTYNSKMIIDNMFQEHTARRYLQGSAQKIKTVAPTYLAPMASASTRVNTTALICWTGLGVGLISFTILGSLYLFQRAERKRWQNQNDEVLIDVIASISE